MILYYYLDYKDEKSLPFIKKLLEGVKASELVRNIVFSNRQLKVYVMPWGYYYLVYNLEVSIPPFYLIGWVLAAFFLLAGFSIWSWLLPLLFGLTGFFFSKAYNDLLFMLSLRKAGVKGGLVKRETLLYALVFGGGFVELEAGALGAD